MMMRMMSESLLTERSSFSLPWHYPHFFHKAGFLTTESMRQPSHPYMTSIEQMSLSQQSTRVLTLSSDCVLLCFVLVYPLLLEQGKLQYRIQQVFRLQYTHLHRIGQYRFYARTCCFVIKKEMGKGKGTNEKKE